MRTRPHYGTEHDNSFIGDIVRAVDQHDRISPIQKDLIINRLTAKPTEEELKVASQEPIGSGVKATDGKT